MRAVYESSLHFLSRVYKRRLTFPEKSGMMGTLADKW